MARFGYKALGEENYFPIQSDPNSVIGKDGGVVKDEVRSLFSLLNMSFTKDIDEKASNTIVVDDIFDVFAKHSADMAKYNAMAMPVLDAVKWFNYFEKEFENVDSKMFSDRDDSLTGNAKNGILSNTEGGVDNGNKSAELSENDDKNSGLQKGRAEEERVYSKLHQGSNSKPEPSRILTTGYRRIETRTIEILIEDPLFQRFETNIGDELTSEAYNEQDIKYRDDERIKDGFYPLDLLAYDILTDENNPLREVFADNIAEYFGESSVNTDIAGNPVSDNILKATENSVVKNEDGQLIPVYHSVKSIRSLVTKARERSSSFKHSSSIFLIRFFDSEHKQKSTF